MKTTLILILAILTSITNISYSSIDKPVTREEYEQKVKRQQKKNKELEAVVSGLNRQNLDLKLEIYQLKYKPEPNETGEITELKQLLIRIKKLEMKVEQLTKVCRNSGIDPNSDPTNIKKLMTKEEKNLYRERMTNYREYYDGKRKYKQKQIKAMSPLDKAITQAKKTDSTNDWEKAFNLCKSAEEMKKVSGEMKEVEQKRRKTSASSGSKLNKRERKAISEGKYFIGMTKEALKKSWGPPEQISKSGTKEKWTYGYGIARMYFHFENGKLKIVENEN